MGFSSQAGHVIFRTQTVPGVFNADTGTAGVGAKLRSGSLGPSRELLIPDPEIGGGRDVSDALLGAVSWSGDYEFYVRADMLSTLLKAALGTVTSPTITDGVQTHSFETSDAAQLPLLSIEEKIGNGLEVYQYTDCVINTLHLEADANGYLMGTVGVIAAKQVAGATATVAPTFDETTMYVGTGVLVEYNSVTLPAKSFSLDINNNFEDDDFRLGSYYLGDLTPKRREITASFGVRHNDSAMWRQATYGSPTATEPGCLVTKAPLKFTVESCTVIEDSVPETPYGMEIDIPQFALTPFALEMSGDDVIESDIEGQALRPNVANPILEVAVTTGATGSVIK